MEIIDGYKEWYQNHFTSWYGSNVNPIRRAYSFLSGSYLVILWLFMLIRMNFDYFAKESLLDAVIASAVMTILMISTFIFVFYPVAFRMNFVLVWVIPVMFVFFIMVISFSVYKETTSGDLFSEILIFSIITIPSVLFFYFLSIGYQEQFEGLRKTAQKYSFPASIIWMLFNGMVNFG